MKKLLHPLLLILSSLFLGFQCSAPRQFTQDFVRSQIPLEETQQIIRTLASDSMKGRDSKNGGYFDASRYVVSFFEKHNILPFYPQYRDSLVTDSIISYNIVGQIGEYDPDKKTVLIGAHLDHIGIQAKEIKHSNLDENTSVNIEIDRIFNGANDNASGCTAVLQIGGADCRK
jgi:hypothetical protein